MFRSRTTLWCICIVFYQLLYVTSARPGFGTGVIAGLGTAALAHHFFGHPPYVPYTAMSPPVPQPVYFQPPVYYQPSAMVPVAPPVVAPPQVIMAPQTVMYAPPTVIVGG